MEFERAQHLPVEVMEWTLDQEGLYDNPLMTEGCKQIVYLSQKYGITVVSITGDCFMQHPFYKAKRGRSAGAIGRFACYY